MFRQPVERLVKRRRDDGFDRANKYATKDSKSKTVERQNRWLFR